MIIETPEDLRFFLIFLFIPNILEYSSLNKINQMLSVINFQGTLQNILINWFVQIPPNVFLQWVHTKIL
jgi:hypothetical protein